jgi:octaprenyl-diphosphate synthase
LEQNLDKINKISQIGKSLGMAFQIADDIMDYSSTSKLFGKDVGRDFLEGKITLPILIARQYDSRITEIFKTQSFTQENFNLVIDIMQKFNIFDKSNKILLDHLLYAKDLLQTFCDSKARSYLYGLIEFLSSRDF